ncbi:HlyD family secretion protein [Sphingomonas astaxanthinifaciens]|uniref:Multidrug resistance efflux pump n=1 Tax=Sphingomonas astaxanthinifaciens DSM 22298 TaxID=1123267 RepID=A0ABQ5Z4U0_9SPHN|nr:HlyD family secretion protein [Sphingomonas astaxanthinifaciens]GLR46670.1 multidrug resistance efflux pump [Sphingomonas astaxanthinifaciens DSM 22298]
MANDTTAPTPVADPVGSSDQRRTAAPPQFEPETHERLTDPIEADTPAPEKRSRGWAPPRSGLKGTLAFVAILIAGALLVLYAWGLPPFVTSVQTTDNAYVRGQTTVIAPQVNGYVTQVFVQDFSQVKAGQPLARIDDRIYRQRVQQAEAAIAAQQASLANSQQSRRSSEAQVAGQTAAVANARAQLAKARADMARVNELVAERSLSLRERDQTLAALRQAEAAVLQAEAQRSVAEEQVRTVTVGRGGLEAGVANAQAQLRLAQIDLANTIIRAPQDGQVSELGVRLGQYVTAGSQMMFLVPKTVWVVANFKEAQTAKIVPGLKARIRVDALGGEELTGTVQQLAPAAGSEFSVIRPDNATGNFVKVAQRIAVRIAIDPGQRLAQRLRPGMSVEARIDTAGVK